MHWFPQPNGSSRCLCFYLKKKKIGNYSTLCKRMCCILESIPECIVISICLMYTFLRGKNSIPCTFVGGESHRGDPYTRGEKTFFYEKILFCLFYFMLVFPLFMVLLVMVSIYALLLSSYHVYVLDMHTSLCYYVLLVACSDAHLFCYMIIVVISIWLFWCMIKLLTCFI